MNHKEISIALNYLLPNSVWTLEDSNYDEIIWLSAETKPTFEELKKALVDYENELKAKRAAAEAKLAALGLTADDLKALGL